MHMENLTAIVGLKCDRINYTHYKSLFRFCIKDESKLNYVTYDPKCITLSNGIELSNVINLHKIFPILILCDVECTIELSGTIHLDKIICHTDTFLTNDEASLIRF